MLVCYQEGGEGNRNVASFRIDPQNGRLMLVSEFHAAHTETNSTIATSVSMSIVGVWAVSGANEIALLRPRR